MVLAGPCWLCSSHCVLPRYCEYPLPSSVLHSRLLLPHLPSPALPPTRFLPDRCCWCGPAGCDDCFWIPWSADSRCSDPRTSSSPWPIVRWRSSATPCPCVRCSLSSSPCGHPALLPRRGCLGCSVPGATMRFVWGAHARCFRCFPYLANIPQRWCAEASLTTDPDCIATTKAMMMTMSCRCVCSSVPYSWCGDEGCLFLMVTVADHCVAGCCRLPESSACCRESSTGCCRLVRTMSDWRMTGSCRTAGQGPVWAPCWPAASRCYSEVVPAG